MAFGTFPRPHAHTDQLLAEIKELCAKQSALMDGLLKVRNAQIEDARSVVRWSSTVPNPGSVPLAGKCRAQMPSTNSARIKTVLVVFDLTIGALTLTIGNYVRTFPNNNFGYIFLNECDFVVGNGDEVSVVAATWTAPKSLSLDVFGREVGDALWIA